VHADVRRAIANHADVLTKRLAQQALVDQLLSRSAMGRSRAYREARAHLYKSGGGASVPRAMEPPQTRWPVLESARFERALAVPTEPRASVDAFSPHAQADYVTCTNQI
jgi:hypothetical protein